MTSRNGRSRGVFRFAAAAGAAAFALSVVSARAADVVTPADWAMKPTPKVLKTLYPPQAWAARVSGSATIACKVTVEGDAADCVVQAEEPAGYGFGQAAIVVVKRGKFHPATKNGVPVEQAVIRVPINFGR
jgi:protein TonB